MLQKYTRYISCFLFLYSGVAAAQADCSYSLSGKVVCTRLNEELEFATIYCFELQKSFSTDGNSHFNIGGLCSGSYHFKAVYSGHLPLDTTLIIAGNREVVLNLLPENELEEIEVEAHQVKKQDIEALEKNDLTGLELDKTRGATLGEALKSVTGVTAVQTGPSIYKPMIHGMYGNRIVIMNNGVRLEGQTWGAEHAPEIDPFIATRLSVIKGAASIRYGMDALAGVVLVDPKAMPHAKSLGGEVNLVGATNGQAGTASGFLEGAFGEKLSGLSWRVQGTFREAGSYRTPDYYLTNTGVRENNYSAALSYTKKSFGIDLFYSDFHTTIGIYSGSHVGNLADLQLLFQQSKPVVASEFSYKIRRGYQNVGHATFKSRGFYYFRRAGKLEYTFARQENRRSEFGEDLSYNQAIVDANIPDAYFQLITHTSELVWEHPGVGNVSGSAGVSYETQGNVYKGLDYRALIPNYRNYSGGAFILEKWNRRKLTLEAGVRYDYKWMRTYTEDFTTLTTHSSDFGWQSFSGSLGSVYRLNKHFSLKSALSTGWRPPAPIELFALGVHQSAASFEIGDTTLRAERSYGLQCYLHYTGEKLQAEVGVYGNAIDNYIYLDPLQQPVITIAGAFPAFRYTQGNVLYQGIDASISYNILWAVQFNSKTTLIYAWNRSARDYLIYTPANRFSNGITYNLDSLWKLRSFYVGASTLAVAKQRRVPANSDYVAPPAGYVLFNAELGFAILIGKQRINVSFSVTNLLNTRYRDYLNRFRYYANDLGRSFTLRVRIPFSILTAADE